MFNDEAQNYDECFECFCFDHTDTCYSSSLSPTSITIDDPKQLTIAAIVRSLSTRERIEDVSEQFPPNQRSIRLNSQTKTFTIDSRIASPNTPENVHFYWRLPENFLHNKLLSYGSYLKYTQWDYQPSSIRNLIEDNMPNIIIRGENISLFHFKSLQNSFPSDENQISVRFWTDQWQRSFDDPHLDDHLNRSQTYHLDRRDILRVLRNIKEILIKATYDAFIYESSIANIELESGLITDHPDRYRSAFVEQCVCPQGYSGTSCEDCAPNYWRQSTTGECVPIETICHCNGYSNECDRFTGRCLNCQNHTQGFHCEQCDRGFYPNPTQSNDFFDDNDDDEKQSFHCLKCPCGSNTDHHHNHQDPR